MNRPSSQKDFTNQKTIIREFLAFHVLFFTCHLVNKDLNLLGSIDDHLFMNVISWHIQCFVHVLYKVTWTASFSLVSAGIKIADGASRRACFLRLLSTSGTITPRRRKGNTWCNKLSLPMALATDSRKFEEKWWERSNARSEALGAIAYHVPLRLIDRLNSRSRESDYYR